MATWLRAGNQMVSLEGARSFHLHEKDSDDPRIHVRYEDSSVQIVRFPSDQEATAVFENIFRHLMPNAEFADEA